MAGEPLRRPQCTGGRSFGDFDGRHSKTACGVPRAALSITRGVIFQFPALERPAEQLPYEIFRLKLF